MQLSVALLALGLVYAVGVLWAPARWPLEIFQVALFAATLAVVGRLRGALPASVPVVIGTAACTWASVQVVTGNTVVPVLTLDGALYWLAATCVVLLAAVIAADSEVRTRLLQSLLYAGVGISVIGIVQCFTSPGKFLWFFSTGYDSHVIGPFVYHNNYAAFVELLVPIALWLALEKKHLPLVHLGIAAWLVASVFASGSRMGTVLVLAEVAAMFFLLSVRRGSFRESGRMALPFLAALVIATLVCGHEFILSRFQDGESYGVRYSFLRSSIAMFQANPIAGVGLGTWPYAYKSFALMDTGSFANHAHNEWAQWAAEGGIILFALVGTLFVWTARAAWKSLWALGLLAVFLHAAVDYPFVRLGLAVWIFALMGVLSASVDSARWNAGRLGAGFGTVLLFVGLMQAARITYADILFEADAVRRAIAVGPARTEFLRRLAVLEPERASDHLRAAVAVNPYDTRSRIELASELEIAGQEKEAEALLLETARLDHQFAPAWALTNHYYRRGQEPDFWRWARRSAALSSQNASGLFELCFQVSNDPRSIYERVVADTRLSSGYVEFLVRSGRSQAVAELVWTLSPADANEPLLQASDALLRSGDNVRARMIWSKLFGNKEGLVNADFSAKISGRGFDWRLHPHAGIEVTQAEDVMFSLTGEQPEAWDLITQPLGVKPGTAYIAEIRYRTIDLPDVSGLFCRVGGEEAHPIPASEEWRTLRVKGVVGPQGYLSIRYQRPVGATRAQGRFQIQRVDLTVDTTGSHV